MSDHDDFDEDASRRAFTAPYTPHHQVPTIQGYQARKEARQEEAESVAPDQVEKDSPQKDQSGSLLESAKRHLHLDGRPKNETSDGQIPYKAHNHNIEQPTGQDHNGEEAPKEEGPKEHEPEESPKKSLLEDTSEAIDSTLDPKQKRKSMKNMKRDSAPREVTDPVTHLRVLVHDSTSRELKTVPENEPAPGTEPRTAIGLSAKSKSDSEIQKETEEEQVEHRSMEKLFPPPNFQATRDEIAGIYSLAISIGLSSVLFLSLSLALANHLFTSSDRSSRSWLSLTVSSSLFLITGFSIGGGIIWFLQAWLKNRIHNVWDDELWEAARKKEEENATSPMPESTQWLNSFLSSVWGLINPDLFTSLADTLEDVMQASLPKLVRMISVEDLGQGSESIRILGIRWLPTGAAAQSVSKDGKVESGNKEESDRKVSGEGQVDDESKKGDDGQQKSSDKDGEKSEKEEGKETTEDESIAEGMEAEEGDFVNVEVAFSYRASSSGKSISVKSKNAHLFLAFYLPGGIRFPVWVELRGIVGTMRMRLQLCPDPPFVSLVTVTLLGQPKADLSCIPLTKKGLNIMDLPIISGFVQSSIDAALAEYVAPKSLTLDLKDMLVGDDFKKDTTTRGILMIRIRKGRDFKEGDSSLGGLRKGSSDAYVAVGWAKFGKPVWSTRVIVSDMQPVWEEITFLLVGPDELNAQERLRVQLWDSDRMSADDDLGRIEVDLKELMQSPNSKGKMWDRTDGFQSLESSEIVPGTLDWSVGYFPKSRIQDKQLDQQKVEPDVKTIQELKDKVSKDTGKKLREAKNDQTREIDQQKAQDLKNREDAMITSTPPLRDYPSGILSVQIHQITGLEFERLNKTPAKDEDEESEAAAGDLPSSYCTVILNHQAVFRTRTKPKNAKPFFNAGTERLIRDWRNTEIMVSVRDSRVHEDDPLLGIIYLPLEKVFQERSQIMDSYPLIGGIGFGRIRISMVFRSVQLQVPKELLGWDYGTIEITAPVTSNGVSTELKDLRLKLRTTVNRGKMYTSHGSDHISWTGKHDRSLHLAVKKRYCSCLVIEFRKNSLGLDKSPAFAVLWLKDIPDEEDVTIILPVWHNQDDSLKRGESNCINDLGEKMGTIQIPLHFHRGLGAFHHRLASKSPNLQDVFEVLSTANDNKETHASIDGESSDTDSSSSDDDDEGDGKSDSKTNGLLHKMGFSHSDDKESHTSDGKGGPVSQIKDYKLHSEKLHRGHRGLMQWKAARTAGWMKTKVEHGRNHLLEGLGQKERDPGVEKEV